MWYKNKEVLFSAAICISLRSKPAVQPLFLITITISLLISFLKKKCHNEIEQMNYHSLKNYCNNSRRKWCLFPMIHWKDGIDLCFFLKRLAADWENRWIRYRICKPPALTPTVWVWKEVFHLRYIYICKLWKCLKACFLCRRPPQEITQAVWENLFNTSKRRLPSVQLSNCDNTVEMQMSAK